MEHFRGPLEQAANLARCWMLFANVSRLTLICSGSFTFSGLKIQTSVERIFRIWKERHIYDSSFLKQLQGAIGECS